MAIDLLSSDFTELRPRILVFGVGGAGGNAVNNMVSSRLEGVEFVVANTDAQALVHSRAQHRLQIGSRLTQGLGAGSRPDIGEGAAEESADDIRRVLANAHMVFITAGMGGGTGTGGAPVIAKIAREMGILTIGVITKPFAFEGGRRMRTAEDGIERLRPHVDTLIIVPNQNLFRIANEKTTFAKAFEMADEVLYAGVRGVTDLMVMPGLINLDFADVRTVMSEMGTAMMGMGEADGDDRAQEAAEAAISNPLLDVSSMKGAKGVLINITGGMDLTLYEVDEAANKIRQEVDPDANIIVGSTFDEKMNGRIRVSVVATGIAIESKAATQPARSAAAADAQKRTATPAAATAPAGTAAVVREANNPVRALQADIIQAGLAVGSLPSNEPVGQNPVDARPFEPDLLSDMPDIRRDMSRQRPLSAPLGAEAKKPGGFSVFGITIGGTSPKARSGARAASPSATQARITGPGAAATPEGIGHRLRPEEISQAMADEKLDIPAFLRRQVN